MAKLQQDNIGAQGQDGINATVGITYLPPNRSMLMLPLQQECPTDPEEMLIHGESTYSIDKMFEHFYQKDKDGKVIQSADDKPQTNLSIEVFLKSKEGADPEPIKIQFRNLKNFEPDDIVDNVPLLRSMKEQETLINRLEQLMQEGSFKNIVKDQEKKLALISFLQSVITDIETAEKED